MVSEKRTRVRRVELMQVRCDKEKLGDWGGVLSTRLRSREEGMVEFRAGLVENWGSWWDFVGSLF